MLTGKGVWGTKSTRVKTGPALARPMLASLVFWFFCLIFFFLFLFLFFFIFFSFICSFSFSAFVLPRISLFIFLSSHSYSLAARQPTRRDESHPLMRRAKNDQLKKTETSKSRAVALQRHLRLVTHYRRSKNIGGEREMRQIPRRRGAARRRSVVQWRGQT